MILNYISSSRDGLQRETVSKKKKGYMRWERKREKGRGGEGRRAEDRKEEMHFCLKKFEPLTVFFNISLFPKLMQIMADITISPIV